VFLFFIIVVSFLFFFLTIIPHIFRGISMKIKIWNQSRVSDFPLISPPQVMAGVGEACLSFI